jgi:hypothetical protein
MRLTTAYELDGRVRFPEEARNFSLFHRVQTGSGAHPMGTGALSQGGKSGIEVKLINHLHLLPRSRMVVLYLHPSYVFMT